MDSANSDSMQSSSGDEEYDSRTDTISPYLNPSLNFGAIISNHPPAPAPLQQPLSSHQSHHPPTLFDPQSHNLAAFSHPNPNANSLYNLDSVWSTRGVLRSDIDQPIYAELGNLAGGLSSSSSSLPSSLSSSTRSLLGIQGTTHQSQFPSSSSMALPSADENGGRSASHQTNNPVAKNTRKRTRASRRAPTTVLTTDTSNFRQMVQEFTGIPAPPFSTASPYSRRLDLFATGSTLRSGHLDSLGPLFPFKPSAQKLQQQQPQQQPSLPFVSSSSSPSLLNSPMIDSIAPITTNNAIATTSIAGPSNNFSSTSSSYQMIPPTLNMQNPVFTFQDILQSSLKYPLPNATPFSSKSHQPSSTEIPSLDELGMTNEHVNPNNLSGFPSHGNSDGIQVGNNNNLSIWRSHEEPPNDGGQQQQQQQQQQHLGSFDGNNGDSSQHYNLNCSGSTSDFHPDKCLENVSSRNEGTVDSWICPSDSDLCSNKQYA